MVFIYNGKLIKKERDLAICNNMDGPRGYYAKWNKSDEERQIPHDFTYMWNLQNKQKAQKTHKYRDQMDSC